MAQIDSALLAFRFSNHRSFREEQELSFVAPGTGDAETWGYIPSLNLNILPVLAIYGANASGKSNALSALVEMRQTVNLSFRAWDPIAGVKRDPFRLCEESGPSFYELDFLWKGRRHLYGFEVDDEMVREEWLKVYRTQKPTTLFHREAQNFDFGAALKGEKRAIEKVTRPNSLFLSAAVQNNHAQLMPIARWIHWILDASGGVQDQPLRLRTTTWMLKDENYRPILLNLLRASDMGITDAKVQKEPFPPEVQRAMAALQHVPELKIDGFSEVPLQEEVIRIGHRGETRNFYLKFDEESDGTQAWVASIGPIVAALSEGRLFAWDELDRSLHPSLARLIVAIFQNPKTNPRGAQLLFTAHDASLMGTSVGEPVLKKEHVWFVRKGRTGESELYPASDFGAEDTTGNLERRYLQGRYAAVPYLEDLASALQGKTPFDVDSTAGT